MSGRQAPIRTRQRRLAGRRTAFLHSLPVQSRILGPAVADLSVSLCVFILVRSVLLPVSKGKCEGSQVPVRLPPYSSLPVCL